MIGNCCGLLVAIFLFFSMQTHAVELQGGKELEIKLTKDKSYLHVIHEGQSVKVRRVQDPDYALKGYYAKTARKCPPFCLQSMQVDPGVATIGEVELFEFMETKLRDDHGVLIDARSPEWFKRGTIPGSINMPFTVLSKAGTLENDTALKRFGARLRGEVSVFSRKLEEIGIINGEAKTEKWDFTHAKELVLWCNGPECEQSPRAIKGLLNVGYPARKIFYYRGGMQMWQLWGLTTVVPGE
jgi:rhodanese-related sulfurtransferase